MECKSLRADPSRIGGNDWSGDPHGSRIRLSETPMEDHRIGTLNGLSELIVPLFFPITSRM
jgi:hypothetical protein